jgi:hypothetical protein
MSTPLKTQLQAAIRGQLRDFVNKHPEAISPSWSAVKDGQPRFVASAEKRVLGEVCAVLRRNGVELP